MPRGWLGARTRPWAKALGAGTLAALLLGAPLPAYGEEPAQARAVGTVTLVTGDRVSVSRQPDGAHLATLLPRDGGKPQGAVKVVERGEDVYVIPAEAQAHVVAGVLDRELFNVTGLLADGHGDGPTPLIVAYDEVSGARAAEQAPAHSTRTATLESIDAVAVEVPAVEVPAGEAAAFWAGLRGSLDAGARQAAPGVKRVWLDPTLEADLAESVPQIGAPAAWKAGFDGAGTTVAVLDTGYDPAHPDLGGKVQGSADFTGSGVADRHGHGTHVAATVAGGGAASSGTHVGVAPGAGLLVGKVLGDDGSGQGSWLIEGMEWAVSQGADVVNMSLSTEATDGTDPLSQAVNELSARSGALFVAAAGNTGPDELTARSPGVADAALSVAAVDKSDVLADFSSRGPRLGDHAVKPDLAAPGVGIVAARAAGTGLGTPAGEAYTSISGTSMAAPHAAGAAAILKQRHPDWTGERIKAALAGSAREVPGTVYEVGAGRVDVARAVTQTVTASPASLSFGRHPHDSRDPVTQTITYRNDGGADVALALAVTTDSPAGLFTLDRSTLTVPGGGTAEARLTLDPRLAESATYGGWVTATGDGAVVRTAFGARKDPRMVQVTVEGITQNGSPAAGGSSVDLWNLDTDAWLTGLFGGKGGPGPAVVSVPVGTYSVTSALWTLDDSGAYGRDVALVAEPEIELTEDTRLVLDARTGSPLNPITPDPDGDPRAHPRLPPRRRRARLLRALPDGPVRSQRLRREDGAGRPGRLRGVGALGALRPRVHHEARRLHAGGGVRHRLAADRRAAPVRARGRRARHAGGRRRPGPARPAGPRAALRRRERRGPGQHGRRGGRGRRDHPP
ncbi:hypothetical protein E1286_28540 [Nonomuraea terrae]|uniref:Peptidase S8/S53 domain-containing protein n=1 Tax=Nonomuraea terrae TaxID=2530383 RepID=A0A4R4YFS5_9ACTN|nr:S8 family serine peptidase [Nonomuraea terrae]TDD43651.1 hypothetical protein E1286_28540 [Nonomuraea terrae]